MFNYKNTIAIILMCISGLIGSIPIFFTIYLLWLNPTTQETLDFINTRPILSNVSANGFLLPAIFLSNGFIALIAYSLCKFAYNLMTNKEECVK